MKKNKYQKVFNDFGLANEIDRKNMIDKFDFSKFQNKDCSEIRKEPTRDSNNSFQK